MFFSASFDADDILRQDTRELVSDGSQCKLCWRTEIADFPEPAIKPHFVIYLIASYDLTREQLEEFNC